MQKFSKYEKTRKTYRLGSNGPLLSIQRVKGKHKVLLSKIIKFELHHRIKDTLKPLDYFKKKQKSV